MLWLLQAPWWASPGLGQHSLVRPCFGVWKRCCQLPHEDEREAWWYFYCKYLLCLLGGTGMSSWACHTYLVFRDSFSIHLCTNLLIHHPSSGLANFLSISIQLYIQCLSNVHPFIIILLASSQHQAMKSFNIYLIIVPKSNWPLSIYSASISKIHPSISQLSFCLSTQYLSSILPS